MPFGAFLDLNLHRQLVEGVDFPGTNRAFRFGKQVLVTPYLHQNC